MTQEIRLLVADDHAAVRQMLTTTLNAIPDMQVVAEANDGDEAVRLARSLTPDVVLLDINMPGRDGVAAARDIVRDCPRTRILMLTALEEKETLMAALHAGAHGFLLKSASIEEILDGIRVVHRHESILSPRSASQLLEHVRQAPEGPREADQAQFERLTQREQEVLTLLACGLSNREIGERLVISELTAKTHVQNLLRRLELRDRFQAAALGIRLGLHQAGGTLR